VKNKGKKVLGRGALDADSAQLMRLVESRQFVELETFARKVLAGNGRHVLAMKALSYALLCLGRDEEVPQLMGQALRLAPSDGELYNNRGIALSKQLRWDEAIRDFMEALRRAPNDPEIHKNLGVAYFRMGRWNDAVAALLKAIEVHPDDYLEAIYMLVWALINAQRMDEAAAVCSALSSGDAASDASLNYALIYIGLRRCDWKDVEENSRRLRTLSDNFSRPIGNAAFAICMPGLDSQDHALIARAYALDSIPVVHLGSTDMLLDGWTKRAGRLRIGYLSEDLRRHAVGIAIAEVICRHDRSRVELFAYSTGVNDGSELRREFEQSFEHFRDVTSLSVHELAHAIRKDGIDILVDLGGWTGTGRTESLAIRCAPIQVNWLGYGGTLGHPKLADYLIGDPVVTPYSAQGVYTEKIVHMPHSFMPFDTRRAIGTAPTRESEGLPDDAFVLCSFNNSYKFNARVFNLWCDILTRMPDAVLWLPRHNDTVAANLQKEFAARGLEPDRLIFARYVDSAAEHFARLQLADLALDTFPYNSHSTGADTLWAGVPMVAKLGEAFAGRVGASLLAAAGMPELIAGDDEGYARLVLDLYRDRPRLADLRQRLVAARVGAPLFDMKKFARDLEDLYFAMADDASTVAAASAAKPPPVPATVP
jgi:predicted O-linked N-acetylglucosamine transferase (SPINDLY family)